MIKISEDKNTIIFDGVLNSAYKVNKDNKGNDIDEKQVINVTPKDIKKVFGVITAYKDSGKTFTPTWFTKGEYIILRSKYNIPFKLPDESKITFNEFVERGFIKNADVVVKMIQKDGAVYPVAVEVKEDGEIYDAFADM